MRDKGPNLVSEDPAKRNHEYRHETSIAGFRQDLGDALYRASRGGDVRVHNRNRPYVGVVSSEDADLLHALRGMDGFTAFRKAVAGCPDPESVSLKPLAQAFQIGINSFSKSDIDDYVRRRVVAETRELRNEGIRLLEQLHQLLDETPDPMERSSPVQKHRWVRD